VVCVRGLYSLGVKGGEGRTEKGASTSSENMGMGRCRRGRGWSVAKRDACKKKAYHVF